MKAMKNEIMIFHAAHILVSTRHEAEDILRKLKEGRDFADLARKFSTCASAPQGGALGAIRAGKADPDFEEAALALRPGETGGTPVRTRFGYHIIRRLAD